MAFFNTSGFSLVQDSVNRQIARDTGTERGTPFSSGASGFGTTSGAAETPGQELEVRGLNDFLRATNQFRDSDQAFQNTINQVGREEAVEKNRAAASASFDTAEGSLGRRQRGLGISLSARQKRSQTRRLGLGRAIADASSVSSTRRGFSDRARAAAKAGLGFAESLRGIEAGGLIGLSNAAGQEKIRRADKKADKKAARAGLIGNIIGIAAAIFSSEDYKHSKRPTTGSLLERLKKVRVEKWKYVGDETDHIGPYSEEFNEAFGVGEDNKQMINLGDAMGVLMGSIKELDAKVEARG